MPNFYFTYGLEGQPYVGGWTEINAPNIDAACAIFRSFHPDKIDGLLNCAFYYTEERWKKTKMYEKGHNFHATCHERIIVTRQEFPMEERHDD